MSKVIAVVEGPTEQTFVREVLGPWLWDDGRVEFATSPAGKPGKKGGNVYAKARRDVINHLNNPHFDVVTTFFDFYGMPLKWPGRAEAHGKPHRDKAGCVEKAIHADIATAVGAEVIRKFRAYIQMCEFEALLFSEPTALADVMRDEKSAVKLVRIRGEFATPEEINDSPQTAPSKRVESVFPFYRKPFHGVVAAKRVTVEKMFDECPHFKDWVTWLRSLGGA
jgi:hypothetical protein